MKTTDNTTVSYTKCVNTVGDLIDALSHFPRDMQLSIDASWMDRNNYCHAQQNWWIKPDQGIELLVEDYWTRNGKNQVVRISNSNTDDVVCDD